MDLIDIAINYPKFILEAFLFAIPFLAICAILCYRWGWLDGKQFMDREERWGKNGKNE